MRVEVVEIVEGGIGGDDDGSGGENGGEAGHLDRNVAISCALFRSR